MQPPNPEDEFENAALNTLFRLEFRGRQRVLCWIETVHHIVRGLESRVDCTQPMELLDELNKANMRPDRLRDVAGLCVRADYQARHTRSVAELLAVELREGVSW